jgi:hypothetical protein
MGNPEEVASFRGDAEPAKETETAASRIGGEFEQAKQQLSQTAASAREDLAEDLRKLSSDVASLRNTVNQLAKTIAAEIEEAAGNIGSEIASSAKQQAGTCWPSSSGWRGAILGGPGGRTRARAGNWPRVWAPLTSAAPQASWLSQSGVVPSSNANPVACD